MDYTIYERIGDVNYRPPTEMTFEEFTEYQNKKMLREYWKTRARGLDGESAVSNRGLIPPIYISPIFDKIFGGSYVDLQPTGFVTLDFGGRWQRVDNPSYPIRQQRNGGFEFDQQINMNVIGQIGDKLKVTANFDNNSSFDFENDFRVEYTGYEEDIIQKIEIGNVSMPVNNSLISGSQNLFGIKTQLRFGRLYVTGVASTHVGNRRRRPG
jgi:cell surface protein SprA